MAEPAEAPGDPATPLGERVELGRSMNGAHYWRVVIPGTAEDALRRAIEIDAELTARYGEPGE